MATRSRIGILNDDGTVDSIYCHWDGYLSHNGKILFEHYTDPAVVQELIALGDISSLGIVIGEKHPFDFNSNDDDWEAMYGHMCQVYGRDRGETGDDAAHSNSIEEFSAINCDAEFYYLFCDGEWLVLDSYGDKPDQFVPLEDALSIAESEAE